jgi:DNA anti-recombination protein RmuC
MGNGIALSDIGSPASFATFTLLAIWVIRTWPHWKSKINEARKIQLDADGERLAQAFARIRVLEEQQSADRREFNEAMSNERKRCDGELDEIRERLTASEERERGLQAMIRQNSQSTAQMIRRPDAVAESTAHRGKRDD